MMATLDRKTVLGDIAIALVFFTRLPFPPFDIANRKLGNAIWAAPLAGLAVALLGALAFTFCDILGMNSGLSAAVALACMMVSTGCLHEDGFADTADAFGGGKTIERKLEIMHDSRLGTYGAAALLCSVLIRWAALASLVNGWSAVCALVAAQMASRGIFGELLRRAPLARDSGLARTVGPVSSEVAAAGLIIGALPLLVLGLWGAVTAILLAGVGLWLFQRLVNNQIGGVTGDTLGAAQQVAEMTILAVASAALG